MQDCFDTLYTQSVSGHHFYDLTELMSSKDNIRLAYRNIKRNTGSKTAGTDKLTINDILHLTVEDVIARVQAMFKWYEPQPVRRVLIPKGKDKTRPLGIPTIWDRIFQQCILQILEPICEAKFHKHSYGFRPNRSTHHAKARLEFLINQTGLHHCVDVDIKGFFDNVNHSKLLKQMWSLGIRDKSLLSIISRLLKAEIEGEGIPTKGTPQGGILSPLLSNIVLNELDWWVSNQWETFESRYTYSTNGSKYQHLKKTALKECFIVRYADDFKVMCRTRSNAIKMNYALKDFLRIRLHLELSEEKSKVVNLKKNSSEFLGFSIKAIRKGKTRFGYVAKSDMSKKAKANAFQKIKEAIRVIKRKPCIQTVWNFNTVVMGIQNYYSAATQITINLNELNLHLRKTLYNQLKNIRTEARFHEMTKTLQKRYKGYEAKLYKIQNMVFVPIHAQRWGKTLCFSQIICNFTVEGRAKIHNSLKAINKNTLSHIMRNYIPNRSIEYNDNRISKFIAQYGKCAILGEELGINDWHCHHINPFNISKDDSYSNLIILNKAIHQLIHLKDQAKIKTLLKAVKLSNKQIVKVNNLRLKCNNEII
ncbi:group II intron reverse transcriptase/maturase [Lysinibacillus sp. G4S2]|uniref:group II intron reverse transcriptase/maturase n=1 Tax=Lysinibacillus sp. G4S2 TaxID=3055859 RepID=UPI0025A0D8FE|nr:group II intron reverse transcriptase/maturase [Lysinibacillus sp. G4S2]MDM5246067.1 group II intron reverse transcriptase/maturase [Lysinibacillus sp. G4S2]MDM5246070.1 group II intron reverse transcriptase/maturase [Lysinibacillus sp. G4S2]MDM5249620.1 group II intron reverse transcriptase/maturase [Lysinibacillus sp. G4S2]MDM5250311.1 group II intron reverse transcriptase/maturase [Lysinibacillus sp. G4S2]